MFTLAESLGMLNSAIQYAGAQIGAVKDKKFIREENEKARQYQTEMWNKANEYNMPSAQMQRFLDAGLNPNLIYGQGTSTLAQYASSPGHSAPNMGSKDIARYGNVFSGYMAAKQLELQNELVQSQIAVNESVESKNIADAEESRSRIPTNLSNKHLIDSITDKNKLDVAFNELTFGVRNAIMNFDAALKEQNVELIRSTIKNLNSQTENNNRLTDMRITAMSEAIAQEWKKIDISEREMIGRLELWMNEGNAAQLNAKANYLNALTNSNEFELRQKSFDKFSDKQLELLKNNVTKLRTFNGWYDMLLEGQVRMLGKNMNMLDKKMIYQDLQNSFFDMNMFMPLLFNSLKY